MGGKRKTPAEVAVKSGEENEKGGASGGKVDDKVILTPTQKAVFWKIIGEGHGGKINTMLNNGLTTQKQRSAVWGEIRLLFYRETGIDMSNEKLRGLWQRLKTKLKQEHDDNIEMSRQLKALKTFTKDCSTTGGGPGLESPQEMDGDMISDDKIDIFDPMSTPYNSLSGPPNENSKIMSFLPPPPARNPLPQNLLMEAATSSNQSFLFSPSPAPKTTKSRKLLQPNFLIEATPGSASLLNFGSPSPSTPSNTIPQYSFDPSMYAVPVASPSTTNLSASTTNLSASNLSASIDLTEGTSLGPRSKQFVDIEHISLETDHNEETLQVQTGPEYIVRSSFKSEQKEKSKVKNQPKGIKNSSTGNVAASAAEAYYAGMLKLQQGLIKERKKLIRQKIRTEQLKQTLLQSKLAENQISLPEMENVDVESSDDQSSDDDEAT